MKFKIGDEIVRKSQIKQNPIIRTVSGYNNGNTNKAKSGYDLSAPGDVGGLMLSCLYTDKNYILLSEAQDEFPEYFLWDGQT